MLLLMLAARTRTGQGFSSCRYGTQVCKLHAHEQWCRTVFCYC